MYLEHYGLSEPPFRITPHTDFFFAGAKRGATLEALLYAITHDEGIVKVSGEVGSGKTMLCRVLMERLPPSVVVIYLANPSLSREEILYALADELGIPASEHGRPASVMRALQEKLVDLYAAGKQVVVLIDEAHAMPAETLEEIRLLSNLESNRHKLLQLVLFGQPELDVTLARPDMRQLRERITQHFRLEPLVQQDIAEYLDFRMRAAGYRGPSVFSPEAVKRIANVSAGLTRRINILADKALLASFASGTHQIGNREIEAAIRDAQFIDLPKTERLLALKHPLAWAIIGAAATLVVIAVWQYAIRPAEPQLASHPPAVPPAPPRAVTSPPLTPSTKTVVAAENASPTPLLDKLLEQSQQWLETVADDRWFIQLFTAIDADDPAQVEIFLTNIRNAGLEMALVKVYRVISGGKPRYGVLYGDFGSRQDAVNALSRLPAEVKHYHPYVRQASRLKLEGKTANKA